MSTAFNTFSSELFFAAAGVTITFISWSFSKEEELIVEFKADEDSTVFEESSVEEKQDIEKLAQSWNENEFDAENIIRQPTPLDEDSLIFLRSVFTPDECMQLIDISENIGFSKHSLESKGSIRTKSSSVFWSTTFSNILFERLKSHLPDISYFYNFDVFDSSQSSDSQTETEFNYYGSIACVNPHFRIEKYQSGQQLKLRRSECVLVKGRQGVFTVYAVVVYLNDEYENEFVGQQMSSFKAHMGDCLVFRHGVLNQGGFVTSGSKYVLRTDVGYKFDPNYTFHE